MSKYKGDVVIPTSYYDDPPKQAEWLTRGLQDPAKLAMRLLVESAVAYGLDHGDPATQHQGEVIVASNHRNFLDIPFIHILEDIRRQRAGLGDRQTTFVMKSKYLKHFWERVPYHLMGGVAVDRSDANTIELMGVMGPRVLDGQSGAIFCEGTRVKAAEGVDLTKIQPKSKPGASILAAFTQKAVLPVAIAGLAETDKTDGRFKVVAVVGQPIEPPEPPRDASKRELVKVARHHKDLVLPALQSALDEAYERRAS